MGAVQPGPLAGVTVVALEQAVAAPFATGRLADAGAQVIKIERPEGDFARGYDRAAKGQSSYFVWLNRGKQSLVLDLNRPQDRDRLRVLVETADIFVQNLKAGAAARLGFDPAELCRRRPDLICCSISGFDDAGPLKDRKAYDLLIQAESGLASITGGPEGASRVGISIVDIATGATVHAAILEALIGRAATGRGADIRISMFDVMADWLTVPLLNHEAGASPRRLGLSHPSIAPYGVFRTADGAEVLISIQNAREWRSLCADVLRQPDLAEDPRFATNVARVEHRDETDGRVAQLFGALGRRELIGRLERAGIAFGEVNDMEGLSRHPELRRITVQTPDGAVSYPAPAAKFAGQGRTYGPAPGLGENALPAVAPHGPTGSDA